MFHRVLMVCIGNICRSPMAEALLKRDLAAKHPNVRVESAGLHALVGNPADPLAVELMRERGIDLTAHRAQQLSPALVREADLILVMDARQQKTIEEMYPPARGKVHRIGRWQDVDVPDPYRQPREAFANALALIERGVADLKRFWP